nr:MAG TPA: hypothetical protein [Caudoviricetes sp.]
MFSTRTPLRKIEQKPLNLNKLAPLQQHLPL